MEKNFYTISFSLKISKKQRCRNLYTKNNDTILKNPVIYNRGGYLERAYRAGKPEKTVKLIYFKFKELN